MLVEITEPYPPMQIRVNWSPSEALIFQLGWFIQGSPVNNEISKTSVAAGVALLRPLNAQWPLAPGMGLNVKNFTRNVS